MCNVGSRISEGVRYGAALPLWCAEKGLEHLLKIGKGTCPILHGLYINYIHIQVRGGGGGGGGVSNPWKPPPLYPPLNYYIYYCPLTVVFN